MSSQLSLWSASMLSILLLLLLLLTNRCECQSNSALSNSVEPFYVTTEAFLDFLQPVDRSILLTDLVSLWANPNDNVFVSSTWQQVFTRYAENMLGFLILACIGLFLIILVPLIGLIVCCCRTCCHRCTGEKHFMERRGSSWRRVTFAILLAIFATLMLFGVVLALISNELLRSELIGSNTASNSSSNSSNSSSSSSTGKQPMLSRMSESIESAARQLRTVPQEAKLRSGPAIEQLALSVQPAVVLAASLARDRLLVGVQARETLARIAETLQLLEAAERNASGFLALFPLYEVYAQRLDVMLNDLKSNLSSFDCPLNAATRNCDLIRDELPKLNVTQNPALAGKDTVSAMHQNLNSLNVSSLKRQLEEMRVEMERINSDFVAIIANETEAVKNELNSTAEVDKIWLAAESLINNISSTLLQLSSLLNSTVQNPLSGNTESLEPTVIAFDNIRYYTYLTIGCVAALVLTLYGIGLVFGVCGEQPYEDASCCNRAVGANFLLAAIIIAFATFSIVFCVILATFIVGGVAETEACRFLSGRVGVSGYTRLDTQLNRVLGKISPGLAGNSLSLFNGLLGSCSSTNTSTTAALNVERLVQASDVGAVIRSFANRSLGVLTNRSSELTSQLKVKINTTVLEQEANATSAINLDSHIQELGKDIITGSDRVINAIFEISLRASDPVERSRFNELYNYANNENLAATGITLRLHELVSSLKSGLNRFNESAAGSSLRVSNAYAKLTTRINVIEAIKIGIANLTGALQAQVVVTVDQILSAAADCRSIGASVQAVIDAPCKHLLRPFNGFWVGIGIFLLCQLPCFILAIKLINLYRKRHKYSPEYFMKMG